MWQLLEGRGGRRGVSVPRLAPSPSSVYSLESARQTGLLRSFYPPPSATLSLQPGAATAPAAQAALARWGEKRNGRHRLGGSAASADGDFGGVLTGVGEVPGPGMFWKWIV